MKTLYLDIFSGISGDMFVSALIDLGVDAAKLERELKKLKLDGYHLHIARKQKSGIAGVKFDVHLEEVRGTWLECQSLDVRRIPRCAWPQLEQDCEGGTGLPEGACYLCPVETRPEKGL